MKNRSDLKSLFTSFALAGLLLTAFGPNAMAQDKTEKATTRKVRVKMFTEINGKQTVVDTVMEVSGDFSIPDLKHLEKYRTEITRPVDILEPVKIIGPDGSNLRSPEEIQKLIDKATNGEVKVIRKEKLDNKIFEIEKLNGQEKIYHLVKPEIKIHLDSAGNKKVFMFRNLEENGNRIEVDRMPVRIEELQELREGRIKELMERKGDSAFTFKRIIIVHHGLTDEEQQMLDKNARKETETTKLKELELKEASLYPNPSSGIFNLSFELSKKGNTSVTVLDGLGREVYRENLKNFKGRYQKELDLSHLSKGMYFLQVIQGKNVYNEKLVIQ